MSGRSVTFLGVTTALILSFAAAGLAGQDLGKRRVQDMRDRWYVGTVEELPDGYRIRTDKGITVTLKKSEVKAILPLEDATPTAPKTPATPTPGERTPRAVTDQEIEDLLAGITIEAEDIFDVSTAMLDVLPVNESSVAEMRRLAGAREDQVLAKDHFVLVYTTDLEEARRLAARLEAIYRWNVKFMQMLNLPVTKPPYKLEIFYFGTHKEFEAYSVNMSMGPTGALGFYRPRDNRSAFFDLSTYPPLARYLEQAKDTRIPARERQFARNVIAQWVDFNNMVVIQHEAGHQIHFNIGLFPRDVFIDDESLDSLPRWLVEGTTMMFEFPPTRAGGSLGTINHGRLDEFDKIYGRKDQDRRLSPQQLKSFILDNAVFLRGGGSTYSLGWGLVNYLWNKKRDKYAEYLRIISLRQPGVDVSYTQREKEFEDLFGNVDDKWIENWYAYLDSLQLKRSLLPPDIRP